MNKLYLYTILNLINGKMYVGITHSPEQRWKQHCRLSCNKNTLITRAIKKYGKENFSFTVWYCGPESRIKRMEQKFILILNTQVPHGYGYNVTIGGDGCLGCQYSEATKDRISKQMSARMKGNKYTLGHPLSAEHKLKISIANKGKKNALGCRRSDETKRKMSLALKGKIVSRETGLKISLAKTGQKKKPIILNNVEYSCIKEAARLLNTNYSTLRDRIRRYGLTGNWPPGCGYVMKQIT